MILRQSYKAILLLAVLFLNMPLMGLTYTDPFQFRGEANSIKVATDEKGHAMAAYNTSSSSKIYTYYYSNNAWNLIYTPICPYGDVEGLVMHSDGTALLTYIEDDSNDLRSLYFNGNEWTIPALDPLDTGISSGGALSINANGHAAVVWCDVDSEIRVNIFQDGAWGTASNPGDIGVGSDPLIGININDDLVVGYEDGSDVYVNISLGGTWSGALQINSNPAGLWGVGIDDNGNSIALIRENTTGTIIANNFLGGSFDIATTLNPGPNQQFTGSPVLGVAPSGTAVVGWNFTNAPVFGLYYSEYDGASWGTAVQFQSGFRTSNPAISMNTNGDALFFYGDQTTDYLLTSFLPLGGPIEGEAAISDLFEEPILCAVSLADNGFIALAWLEGGEGGNSPFGMALQLLPAPTGLRVKACVDRDAISQVYCIDYLTWDYSSDPNVESYNILRNGVFYGNVGVNDPQTYTVFDVICGERVVYAVEALDFDGIPGYQITFTLN